MEKEIICISCPIGCRLNVSWDEKGMISGDDILVKNNKCSRGEIYGREEILAPKRTVTATCSVSSVHMGRIPVKTTGPVLKGDITALFTELYKLRIRTPVAAGDIVIRDFRNTGVDVVVTRSLSE